MFLKQSTATTVTIGPFIDDTDGKTPETSLTVTGIDTDIYKNTTKTDLTITASGGNNDMAHVANGYYSLELTSGNTDTIGRFMVTANISGALPVWREFVVLPGNVYDSMVAGSAKLAANAAEAGGTAWATVQAALVDAVWDEPMIDHTDLATTGGSLAEAGADWTGMIANAVWDEPTAGHHFPDTIGEALLSGTSAAEIADAVWDEALSGHMTAGSMGVQLSYAGAGSYINGSNTAADNLKKAFDGTGYSAAGLTVGTVTNVTNHVLADLRKIGGSSTGDYTAFIKMLKGVVSAAVVAGTNTTTVISTGLPSTANGFYTNKTLFVSGGTHLGEGGRVITAYDGATKRVTVSPALTGALAAGDEITIIG